MLDNDVDLDGDRLHVRSVSPAGHGAAEVAADGTLVSYVPDPNYHGPDRFTYVVADADGLADTATVERHRDARSTTGRRRWVRSPISCWTRAKTR